MYFITCFTKVSISESGELDLGDYRTIGYFKKYKDAHIKLTTNYCDIFEATYNYAVVEHIKHGVYLTPKERWFYKYDEEKGGYVVTEEPNELKYYTNISWGKANNSF